MNPQPSREIRVETYLGTPIRNFIEPDPTPRYVAFNEQHHRILLASVNRVGPPSGRYNCHGLVFASRRTNIPPPGEESRGLIDAILREEQFGPVTEDDAREGDIAVWRRGDDIDHAGIVVYVQRDVPPRVIFVWSKWGTLGEFVHSVHLAPYNDCTIEYWRLGRQ